MCLHELVIIDGICPRPSFLSSLRGGGGSIRSMNGIRNAVCCLARLSLPCACPCMHAHTHTHTHTHTPFIPASSHTACVHVCTHTWKWQNQKTNCRSQHFQQNLHEHCSFCIARINTHTHTHTHTFSASPCPQWPLGRQRQRQSDRERESQGDSAMRLARMQARTQRNYEHNI